MNIKIGPGIITTLDIRFSRRCYQDDNGYSFEALFASISSNTTRPFTPGSFFKMSTSLLYHVFGLIGYFYQSNHFICIIYNCCNAGRQVAIDEIYQGKKLGYLIIVIVLQSGAVVFVGNGKNGDALTPFWKRLKRSCAQIDAVATDIGPAYICAVRTNLPEATLVFDHFHIIKLFNEKLTKLRRDLQQETENGVGKPVLKGICWLLLKNPDNLDDTRNVR